MNRKTEFTELTKILKALGNEKRLQIIQYLASHSSCITGSIVDEIDLAQSTTSQHLRVLKNAGIIKGTIEGTSTCYCLDKEYLKISLERIGQLKEDLNL